MSGPKVCVVGSSNLDMNTYVDRFPAPGETIHGRRFTTGYGGKGANQAVMAARLGAEVVFVSRVGADVFGRDMLDHFRREGIDPRYVSTTDNTPTGVAVITVDVAGRNHIVVTPGANGELTSRDVEAARPAIEAAGVLVCQMEVPLDANLTAMRIAAAADVPVVFNPAPASAILPDEAYRLSTVFCPNEHEARLLTGMRDEADAARELQRRGARNVVITLGERGCLLATADHKNPSPGKGGEQDCNLPLTPPSFPGKGAGGLGSLSSRTEGRREEPGGAHSSPWSHILHIPTEPVEVVDTTGAGDAFVGSLAVFLARGLDLADAARRANRIAAISVRSPGTQTSFPRAADLPAGLR
jgi:ribokinase